MAPHEIRTLFGRTYQDSRENFLAAAAERGLLVDSYPLPLEGAQGEVLATDVVYDGAADASKLIIVLSGVHGVEGYCGSAVQCGILGLGPVDAQDTAVLHVHALNPYGFSHSRRVTQENVDLNRNFIDFSQPLPVNDNYALIDELLLPEQWPPAARQAALLAQRAEEWGARGFQRAVSSGQYSFADGLFFGGTTPTWSNRTFRAILRRYAAQRAHIAGIDIHTGLGPYGLGERIFASPDDDLTRERARDWWGDLTFVTTGSSTSIPMTGPVQTAMFEECSRAVHTHICLEFGTYPVEQVMPALRAEHWLHRYGSDDSRLCAALRQTLKDVFYPQADDWQQSIWQQGHEVFVQALNGLRRTYPGRAAGAAALSR